MNKELTLIARLVAVLCALTFTIIMALSVTAFAVQRQFLRPDPYIQALSEVNAYGRAPGILGELFTIALDDARTSGLTAQLPFPEVSQSDVELFLTILLPRDWLQSQSEIVVRRAIADLNGRQPQTPSVVSLVEIKERLNGPQGTQALQAVIETRPVCSDTDLSALTCGFNLAGEITCRPPGLNFEVCGAAIGLAAGGIASLMPDQVDLDSVLQISDPISAPLRDYARRYASAVSLVARFGWIVALPFLLGATLFGVRSFSDWLRWWGAPLLSVATVLLPIAAITLIWPSWYMAAPLAELAQGAPALAQLLTDVAGVLSQGLVLILAIAMLLFGAVGFGMLALSFIAPALYRWVNQG